MEERSLEVYEHCLLPGFDSTNSSKTKYIICDYFTSNTLRERMECAVAGLLRKYKQENNQEEIDMLHDFLNKFTIPGRRSCDFFNHLFMADTSIKSIIAVNKICKKFEKAYEKEIAEYKKAVRDERKEERTNKKLNRKSAENNKSL